jgi:hypothetical protein
MPIDIDPVCCGPGGIPPNYTVAGSQCSSGGGTMPVRLHRHTVPVPLVLHSAGQFMLSGNGPASEVRVVKVWLIVYWLMSNMYALTYQYVSTLIYNISVTLHTNNSLEMFF